MNLTKEYIKDNNYLSHKNKMLSNKIIDIEKEIESSIKNQEKILEKLLDYENKLSIYDNEIKKYRQCLNEKLHVCPDCLVFRKHEWSEQLNIALSVCPICGKSSEEIRLNEK